MIPQAIQPRLDDIVYEMAAIAKLIPLKGGIESLSNINPAIGDDCKEVHMQIEQIALLQCKSSNSYPYRTIQQLGKILRRDRSRGAIEEECRGYTHLGGQLPHLAHDRIPNTRCQSS